MRRHAAAAVGLVVLGVLARRRWGRHLSESLAATEPVVRAEDGVTLHVQVTDDVRARLTVVFSHGFAVTLDEFDDQYPTLRGAARLVRYDQRGHGRSGWGSYRRATIRQLGRDLGAVLDACAPDAPVVLVGHSMGAMAVLALAAQRGDLIGTRVVGAALVSISAGRFLAADLDAPVGRLLVRPRLLRGEVWLMWLLAPLFERFRPLDTTVGRRWVRRVLFGTAPVPPATLDALQRMLASTRHGVAAAFYPTFLHHDQKAGLRALRGLPAVVVCGADDRVTPLAHAERLARGLGSADLVVVPGAGHMVNLTDAAVVNRAVLGLLDRV